jgi:hypothetical protein
MGQGISGCRRSRSGCAASTYMGCWRTPRNSSVSPGLRACWISRKANDSAEVSSAAPTTRAWEKFKSLADFDHHWPKQLDKTLLEELFNFDFLEQGVNIIIVGYLSYDARYADLLFEVITRCYQLRRPVVLTTNKLFGEWSQVFPNATMEPNDLPIVCLPMDLSDEPAASLIR